MKIRAIHVAFLLSVLIHVAALWTWLPHMRLTSESNERLAERAPLELRLEPPAATFPTRPAPPSRPQTRSEPLASVRPAPPKRVERPPARRPEPPAPMTQPAPAAEAPAYSVPEPVPAPPPAPRAAPGTDLSSYIEARRRARQQSESPAAPSAPPAAEETEDARANRIAAANLGLGRKPSFGEDATGGGLFQIQRLTYDYAEYLFYGWNTDIRRNTTQLITVRKGLQPDIRRAVVRSMIDIIRRHEQGDFLWVSRRLGRNVSLSARPSDDAGLEDFLMREFFDEGHPPALSRAP